MLVRKFRCTSNDHARVDAAHVGQLALADVVNVVEPDVVIPHRGWNVPAHDIRIVTCTRTQLQRKTQLDALTPSSSLHRHDT